MSEVVIRPAQAKDEARWRELWAGYVKFYRATVSEEATANTWANILAADSGKESLVAEAGGRVIGICTYLYHLSTWNTQPTCYLEDLYVDTDARGGGVAKALILACEAEAKKHGAFRLYWNTQEYNAPARSLYDTLATRSSFVVYRKPL